MRLTTKEFAFLVVSMLVLSVNQPIRCEDTDNDEPAYPLKRSLCNTFGGCGSKRSIQQLGGGSLTFKSEQSDSNERIAPIQNVDESQAILIAEILDDLVDYLKTSEKYKRAKYVVMVPSKQQHDNSMSNNLLTQNSPDLQELQLKRLYFNTK